MSEHPDRAAAWEAMNRFGRPNGENRTLGEVVLEVERLPKCFGDSMETTLVRLFMTAYMMGAQHGRLITYQAFVGTSI
jgi:hypothetical protein